MNDSLSVPPSSLSLSLAPCKHPGHDIWRTGGLCCPGTGDGDQGPAFHTGASAECPDPSVFAERGGSDGTIVLAAQGAGWEGWVCFPT